MINAVACIEAPADGQVQVEYRQGRALLERSNLALILNCSQRAGKREDMVADIPCAYAAGGGRSGFDSEDLGG